MATLHVTATLALAWSVNPSASSAFIENCVLTTCQDLGAGGYDTIFGHGLIDASAAVTAAGAAAPPPPAAPTNLTATAGDHQVSLNWTASEGATYYDVHRTELGGSPWEVVGMSYTTSFTDYGLVKESRTIMWSRPTTQVARAPTPMW